jgi:serine/threonine protein kinase
MPAARCAAEEGIMIGKTISHYRIVEKLGEGGMGVVYKARDAHLDRSVGLKVIPVEKVYDTDCKLRFVQQCGAFSDVNLPANIEIVDFNRAESVASKLPKQGSPGQPVEPEWNDWDDAPEFNLTASPGGQNPICGDSSRAPPSPLVREPH